MSESDHSFLKNPDSDEWVDAAQNVLLEAGYNGKKEISPAFRDWFIEELSQPGMDVLTARAIFETAVAGIQFNEQIEEINALEVLWHGSM